MQQRTEIHARAARRSSPPTGHGSGLYNEPTADRWLYTQQKNREFLGVAFLGVVRLAIADARALAIAIYIYIIFMFCPFFSIAGDMYI